MLSLQWHHNERNRISNHWRLHCLLKCWFRYKSKKTSKLHITGLCAVNLLVTGEFLAQKASNAENIFIWWRHHDEISQHIQPQECLCCVPVCSNLCTSNIVLCGCLPCHPPFLVAPITTHFLCCGAVPLLTCTPSGGHGIELGVMV